MVTATDFREAHSAGSMTALSYAKACLQEIERSEGQIRAWEQLVPDAVRQMAEQADSGRAAANMQPLLGVPVGIKDIIDTTDAPCACGSAALAGRQPEADATLVTILRRAGAVIFGKTVTTEFAYLEKSRTRNPINHSFSPGGSSSGSAAAVAAGHIPLAVGTQTGGSVIRPASYCEVHALKPTHTAIDKKGVLQTSQTLDQVGFFAGCLDDICLLSSVLVNTPPLAEIKPASVPRLLMWQGLYGEQVEAYVHEGLQAIAAHLGAVVDIYPAPQEMIARFQAAHKTIYDYEISQNLHLITDLQPDKISALAKDAVWRGRQISTKDYQEALLVRDDARTFIASVFEDYDGLLSASATGQPPAFENGTGNPACNTVWSLCGAPCLSLPLSGPLRITGPDGLGVGLQLIAGLGHDEKLLRTGQWLEAQLTSPTHRPVHRQTAKDM